MQHGGDHIEQMASLARTKSFLGREFLTWIWFIAETSTELLRVTVEDQELEVDLWIDDRLILEGTAAMSHSNLMKGGDPSHSREAAVSLSTGKTVREMKLGLRIKDGGEFSAVLNCEDLNPRSLKLPSPPTTDDSEQDGSSGHRERGLTLEQRLRATSQFASIIDSLFARFLSVRTDASWDKTMLVAMRGWIKQRQGKLDSGTLH